MQLNHLNTKVILDGTINLLKTHKSTLIKYLLVPLTFLAILELYLLPDYVPHAKSALGFLYLLTNVLIFLIYANVAITIHRALIVNKHGNFPRLGIKLGLTEFKYMLAILITYLFPFAFYWISSDWAYSLALDGYSEDTLRVIYKALKFSTELCFIVVLSFWGLALPHIAIKNEISLSHALSLSKGSRGAMFLSMLFVVLITEAIYVLFSEFYYVDSILLLLLDWVAFTFIGVFSVAILSATYRHVNIEH
ncbi:hypothetical protein RGQ13_15080 [Thalassotalea psychrophila]|uniref:Uncharacterized protein n=1 Tax=Thalassotalea psychrophila TaxID=3065647 RepID=A0ABY9TUI5_9GAMM|nr:hypothetical protein RGQ13_15080 [Colwelliaceae bacterium SQ149]